jgi:prepilin-type N-terminal cleavage/methylation domain-containing protein
MNKRFSLIELMVVVAIIGILSSLLLPSLNKARKNAKLASCLSTERQIGISVHLYSDDNENYYPAPYANYGWDDMISSYYGLNWSESDKKENAITNTSYDYSKLQCPSDDIEPNSPTRFRKSYSVNDYKSSSNWLVGIMGHEFNGDPQESRKSTDVTNPSRTIMIGEQWNKWNFAGGAGDQSHGITAYFAREFIFNPGSAAANKVKNHFDQGISNYTLTDGSAKKMSSYQVLDGCALSSNTSNFRGSWFDSSQ